ncbi:MAG: hypothetical protein Q8918_16235 [Bacteroidota bacterium]|nr:hypothetical protein [Bacteroidota bacterium]
MKPFLPAMLFIAGFSPLFSFAQLTNGGINAYFGVDGDTRNNYVKYGPATGSIASDDWFSPSPSGKNVIDTSGAAGYLTLLQSGNNLNFNQRMSVPLYSKINGKLWLDAVYGRDYIATSPLFDSTIFTSAAKNGDNPVNWSGGKNNIPDKNDLTDVFAHMRRDGINVHDSLWFFTGASTVGNTGSSYLDIELYKNSFSYNAATGTFSTAGPDAGHTQWIFDASGNIIQTGDMIVAVNYSPGTAPVVDVRIWVSQTTFSTVTPAYFKFGASFDGATPAFGYASILSKTGTTSFGSGIGNYSATATQDTTYSTPWGTENSLKVWDPQYQSQQFVEVGLNLTRIGVDPALYTSMGLSACQSLFSSIFFKSRSSNSFTSNMQDFVTPLEFLRMPVMDYTLQPDTLRCNRTTGTIQITNNTTNGYYSWQTTDGNITSANTDSSQISMNKPGTYTVSASPAEGCPATRIQNVVIPIDTFPPVASIIASITTDLRTLLLYGGDVSASNYPTPFGGSQGLLWDWSGPKAFTSTIQNPSTDTAWGTYQLIVTEKRNGCKDTAVKTLSYWDFAVLGEKYFVLDGVYANQAILLDWQSQVGIDHYEIEKSVNGIDFIEIGSAVNPGNPDASGINLLRYTDNHAVYGDNYYRIKYISADGKVLYSNVLLVNAAISGHRDCYLASSNTGNGVSLVCNTQKGFNGTVVLYTIDGKILQAKNTVFYPGENVISLSAGAKQRNTLIVVSLFENNKLSFTGKSIF